MTDLLRMSREVCHPVVRLVDATRRAKYKADVSQKRFGGMWADKLRCAAIAGRCCSLDVALNPEDNLLHAERHDLLHQAVLRIPAPLRIVLVLHDLENLTTDQVAQVLGRQSGTVRVRLPGRG